MSIVLLLIVVLISFLVIQKNGYQNSLFTKNQLIWLNIYHLSFSVFFFFYTKDNGGDAWAYWVDTTYYGRVTEWAQFLKPGTFFIHYINYPLVKFFDLSFLFGTFIYGFFGFIGFILVGKIIYQLSPFKQIIGKDKTYLIFFLPNLHVWSAGIGKDTLIFFGIILFFYSIINFRERFIYFVLSSVLIYFIRPHIFLIIFSSLSLGLFFSRSSRKNSSKFFKFVGLVAVISIIGYFFNSVMEFAGLEDTDSTMVFDKIDRQVELLQSAKSGIDISSYSLPLKIITFWFRPLIFDAHSLLSLVASFENLFLIFLLFKINFKHFFKFISKNNYVILSMASFFIAASVILSSVMSNLGLAMRQKNMVLIFTIIILAVFVNSKKYLHFSYRNKI